MGGTDLIGKAEHEISVPANGNALGCELANFYCKESESKYFRLCRSGQIVFVVITQLCHCNMT